jgi:hypothetical protein
MIYTEILSNIIMTEAAAGKVTFSPREIIAHKGSVSANVRSILASSTKEMLIDVNFSRREVTELWQSSNYCKP